MTYQIVCDECGKSIDQSKPYYELSGSLVQMEGDLLTVVEPAKQMHYHQDHLGEEVLEPADVEIDIGLPGEPEPPVEPPQFTEDISAMTIQQALAWADDDPAKLQYAIEQEEAGQNRRSLVDQLQNKLDALTP